MSNHSCEMMDVVREQFPLPFVNPLYIDPKTLELGVADLSVELYKKTPSGNISKRGSATLSLNFCPFCGKRLSEIEAQGK